jgi:methylenetetrahydrofolate dehydrogenase (NADP+)/methenyltetrahydrofolate cyclohydrolase
MIDTGFDGRDETMNGPQVLDGKSLAETIERELAPRVERLKARSGRTPVLATILVGSDPASATYVRMKGNACRRVGMESSSVVLPEQTTTAELLARIDALNADPAVQGILLQHPAPPQIDERACFDRIAAGKDVDGVTALGFGRMSLGERAYGSATPAGIIRLLDHHGIELEGAHAVVVGRSPILGKPMAMMLLNRHATVTICHSRTRGLPAIVRQADIVVAAVGRPRFVQGDWIKDGAVIVDAGFHPDRSGDVDLASAAPRSSAYTPVPGGVGPMTIATLISQCVEAAERAFETPA